MRRRVSGTAKEILTDFPSFSEGLSLRPLDSEDPRAGGLYFPSFSEGLSLRLCVKLDVRCVKGFPFLFGGTFIEAHLDARGKAAGCGNFPSFSEGLSLRHDVEAQRIGRSIYFPSFSEGLSLRPGSDDYVGYPGRYFPSFSEGLSLRPSSVCSGQGHRPCISLPFRRDFH